METETSTDAAGGELRVVTGAGRVTGIEPRGDRRVAVVIATDESGPDIVGELDAWCAPEEIIDGLLRGEFTNRRVRYRIEIQRRAGVAPTIPLDELQLRDVVREMSVIALLAEVGQ